MTTAETRNLGIEFERRLIAMYPDFAISGKLDTQTIYSFLNEYQIQYVKSLYAAHNQAELGSMASSKIMETLSRLTKQTSLLMSWVPQGDYETDAGKVYYRILPNDLNEGILGIIRVTPSIVREPGNKSSFTKCIVVNSIEFGNILESFNDKGRILRTPVFTMEDMTDAFDQHTFECKILTDKYTKVNNCKITYYRLPKEFTILGDNPQACELPKSCFDELVQGAVELYMMRYKFGLSLAANDRSDSSIKKGLRNLTKDNQEANQ